MLSLQLILLFFFTTFAFFLFTLHTLSVFQLIFLYFDLLCSFPQLMSFPRTMILGSWLSYLFLQCPELQYFFFLFSALFAFHLIWLFLFSYAFLVLTIPDCVSPVLHMPFYFCILCWTKTGDKVKVALHLTLQILLDMLSFWPLFTQLCSPTLCLLLNPVILVFTNFALPSFTSILCPFFRRFCLHVSVTKARSSNTNFEHLYSYMTS